MDRIVAIPHVRVSCDRCRRIITADRTELTVESGPLRSRRETIDLCTECSTAQSRWLDANPLSDSPAGSPLREMAALKA